MIGDDETNFPHKLLLINREAANLWKAFADKSSTDIKLSKIQHLRGYNQKDSLVDWLVHY